jgi:hypothetical protein
MKLTVFTVDQTDKEYARVREDIEKACSRIIASDDSFAENYSPQNFKLDQQAAISASYIDDQISIFSTIMKRDFYPEGTYRVFNRFWRNPAFRKNYPNKFVPAEILTLVQQQYLFTQAQLKARFIFISREKSRNLWLQHVLPKFDMATEDSWWLTDDSYLVCDNRNSEACWQKLLYCNLDKTLTDIPLEKRN